MSSWGHIFNVRFELNLFGFNFISFYKQTIVFNSHLGLDYDKCAVYSAMITLLTRLTHKKKSQLFIRRVFGNVLKMIYISAPNYKRCFGGWFLVGSRFRRSSAPRFLLASTLHSFGWVLEPFLVVQPRAPRVHIVSKKVFEIMPNLRWIGRVLARWRVWFFSSFWSKVSWNFFSAQYFAHLQRGLKKYWHFAF